MPQPPANGHSPESAARIDRIDALLPQTQCGLCKTAGCRPYAEAIAAGAPINHCVPGGQPTIDAIAELLQVPALPPDPAYGTAPPHRLVALIREDECIGCTKCIQACPVDAIVGAARQMHTVLADECTGCNLCVPPCPVDCIDLVPGPDIPMTWHPVRIRPQDGPPVAPAMAGRIPLVPAEEAPDAGARQAARARADHARDRYLARNRRLAAEADEKAARRQAQAAGSAAAAPVPPAPAGTPVAAGDTGTTAAQSGGTDTSGLMIAAAMARSQLKKAEKQIAALLARGESAETLQAQLPALQAAVATAQAALARAQQAGAG